MNHREQGHDESIPETPEVKLSEAQTMDADEVVEDEFSAIEQLESLDPERKQQLAIEGVAEAFIGAKLDAEQQEALGHLSEGLKAAAKEVDAESEQTYREMVERMLQERYSMTLSQLLGAFKPTRMEKFSIGTAMGQEVAIWAVSKAFEVEPEDLSLQEKAEFRWKVGGDVSKVLSLLTKLIPQARVVSVPLSMLGNTLDRMGDAMERVNANPDATVYQATREVVLASLPRDDGGEIDREATLKMIRDAGGLLSDTGEEEGVDPRYLASVSDWIKNNPEKLVGAVERIDARIQNGVKPEDGAPRDVSSQTATS